MAEISEFLKRKVEESKQLNKEKTESAGAEKSALVPAALASKTLNAPDTSKAVQQMAHYLTVQNQKQQEQQAAQDYEQLLQQAQADYDTYTASEEYLSKKRMRYAQQGQAMLQTTGASTYPAALQAQAQGNADGGDQKERELRAIRDYYQNQVNAQRDKAVMDADLAELETWTPEDRAALDAYVSFRQNSISSGGHAVPAQNAYQTLVDKYGKEKVANLAESWQRSQNAKATQELQEAAAANVKGKVGASFGHSAATIPANILGAVTGPLGIAGDIATGTGRYSTLDPNNIGNMANVYSGAVRGQVAEDISGDQYDEQGNKVSDGGVIRQVLATGYQGIMSAVDSAARAAAYGPASLGLAASGAFTQTVSDASRQGATPEQAMILGVGTAAIEAATEKIPLDEMLSAAKGGVKGAMGIAKEALKQAGVEATTEEISLFGSLLLEAVVLREKSSYEQNIADAIAHGASYEEAREQADQAVWNEALQTAAVSAIAGGASGGGSAVVGNIFGDNARMPGQAVETAPAAAETVTGQQEATPLTQEQMDANAIASMGEQLKPQIAAEQAAPLTEGERQLDEGIKMTMGMETAQEQKNAASEETTITIKSATTALTEENQQKNTLAYELATRLDSIRDMEPVSQLTGNEFQKTNDGKKISDKLREFFKTIGNKVSRNGFGDVEIGEYGIGAFLTHKPINRARAVSMAAVPDVIRSGRQIGYDPNWKGRGYPSYIFAAPVKVAGTDLYVAAVVNQLPDNKFYLSEMVDSEGNYVRIEESPSGNSKNGLPMGPENQQGRDYAGPEELSKGSDPTAKAEPTPLLDNIIREGNPEVKGTGAAEANFSGKAVYQNLLTDENAQPDRAGDVRLMEVPKTDANGNPVSEVAGNVYASGFTSDEFASLIEEKTASGGLSYARITNDQATEYAKETITRSGSWEAAYTQWATEVDRGAAGAEISARGALLLNHAAQQNNKAQWMDILCSLQKLGTNTAQGLQAMRLVRELSPPDKLEFAKATVRKMVADMKLRNDVSIDESLLDAYQNAETDQQRDEVMEMIQQNVADQIPPTAMDKLNALRYTNMLGNLKTPMRNTLSNIASSMMYRMKDQIAAGIDDVIAVVNPEYQKTKAHFVGKEYMDFGRKDFRNIKAAVSSGGKYSGNDGGANAFAQGVMDKRKVFRSAPLEEYRKATNWIMNNKHFGDEAFGREAYSRALAGYLKANGVKASELDSISDDLMDKARAYAVQQAQEATLRDNSALARIASNVQRATGVVGQGIMPFTKTPANVLTRAAEFSPLGILDTAAKSARLALSKTNATKANGILGDIARGGVDITGADIVDSLSKTLTGTAIFALGAALWDQGWISTGEDDDENKAKYDDLVGKQTYAFTLPDGTSYTLDWLSPAALPLFMGAEFRKVASDGTGLTFADLEQVFTAIADPMIQMSMLQGINDSLENIKYSDNNLAQFLINACVSYLTQGLTNTLLGQIERSTEETRQTTYVDKDSQTPEWLQRQLGKASQKIPGWDYQQMEYRNAWGETEENEGGLLYNLLSPGYLSKEQQSAISDELYRLNDAATGMNVFPQIPEKTLTYTDNKGQSHDNYALSQAELETIQKVQGQTAAKLLGRMIQSGDYQKMTDDQKAHAIKAVYEFAAEQGKQAAIGDYHSKADSWIKDASEQKISTFIERGALQSLNTAVSNTVASLANGWEVTDADKQDMNKSYAAFRKMSKKAQERILENAVGDTVRYLEARKGGVSTENYISAVQDVKALGSDAPNYQKYAAIADSGLRDKDVDILMRAYMTDYDPESSSPDKTELRYNYARQELGLSPEQYADVYEAFIRNSSKETRMQAWLRLGYSQEEAEALWNLFGASGENAIDVVGWSGMKTYAQIIAAGKGK